MRLSPHTYRARRVRRVLSAAVAVAALATTVVLPQGPSAAHAAVTPHARTDVATATAQASATPTATSPSIVTAPVTPTASPTPSPTATPRPIKPPKPFVHRTNGYQIGAYYFSGWSHGQNDNLTPFFQSGPLQKYQPLIGWYDDSQGQVDKHILQATSAGIDFFAFDWYDIARSPYATDKTLNEALGFYLSSRYRSRMNFVINFVDQAPFLPRSKDWGSLVSAWITYFKQPDYVKVNGKPLFIVFSPEHMRDIFGSSKNVRRALDYLRIRARQAHLPGVTVAVAATLASNYNPARVYQLRSEGYDVTTGYNYHSMGGEKYRKPVPYSHLMQENRQMWDRVAGKYGYPYIPVITSGWDQRFSYREQKTAIIYSGRTPAQFSCYAAAARHWIDTNAKHTVKEKLVLVFAWNEIGEGGMIIPTHADGSAYTDALHRVFTARHTPTCR